MNYKELYDTLYKEGYHIRELKNWGIMFVEYLCKTYQFNNILDVGCSNGLTVKEYIKYDKSAYGIDISDIAVNKAKELGILSCSQGSILDIPYTDNFFDAIVSCDVIEHLELQDIPKAVKELKRVTSKYLFIKVATGIEKNRSWIDLLHKKYKKFKDIDNLHLTTMSLDEWIKVFTDEGLKLIEINKDLHNILIFEK